MSNGMQIASADVRDVALSQMAKDLLLKLDPEQLGAVLMGVVKTMLKEKYSIHHDIEAIVKKMATQYAAELLKPGGKLRGELERQVNAAVGAKITNLPTSLSLGM